MQEISCLAIIHLPAGSIATGCKRRRVSGEIITRVERERERERKGARVAHERASEREWLGSCRVGFMAVNYPLSLPFTCAQFGFCLFLALVRGGPAYWASFGSSYVGCNLVGVPSFQRFLATRVEHSVRVVLGGKTGGRLPKGSKKGMIQQVVLGVMFGYFI